MIRKFTFLTLCLTLIGGASPSSPGAEKKKPNILLIVCDDLNTRIGPSGYGRIHTPALDKLASEAMTFRHAHCQYPVCGPSRASFLHGLYPESSGVLDNTADIRETRPKTVSLPQHFKQNGYWTACTGKVFHSPRHEHGEVAWDKFHRFENDELPVVTEARKKFEKENGSVELPENRRAWKTLSKEAAAPLFAQTPPGHGPSGLTDKGHKDGKNASKVIDWLQKKPSGDKPFFIACGIHKPHVAFLAPQKYFDLYPREKLTFDTYRPKLWNHIPASAQSKRYTAFGFELGKEDDALRREYIQAYFACISFIDAQIGSILDTVKEQGLWEDTVIIFFSDHGYHLGEHFMWGKVTLFDFGTRVPFIVHAPDITSPGSTSDALVELVDIFSTLSDLAGTEPPTDLQGRSLVPNLKDPTLPGKPHTYTVVTRGKNMGRAITGPGYRYTEWPDGEEYYDHKRDPRELRNLANNPEIKTKLESARELLKAKASSAASARNK